MLCRALIHVLNPVYNPVRKIVISHHSVVEVTESEILSELS